MRRGDEKLAALAGQCALELFLEEADAAIAGVDDSAVAGVSLENWLMEALDKRERETQRTRRMRFRAVAASLIIAMLAGAALMGYEPIRAAVTRFFAQRFPQFSEYGLPGQTRSERVGVPEMRFARPAYVPEGFKVRDWDDVPGDRTIYWLDAAGEKSIFYSQLAEGFSVSIDTENAYVWQTQIDGAPADVIEKQGLITIVFARDGALYEVSAHLPFDECMKIAQSITMDDELEGDER